MNLVVLPPIPSDIKTEDVLRDWVLDQGVNWWDFVLTPDYDDWTDDHVPASGSKSVVHVDDYVREGHFVHGYDRSALPRGFPPGLWHPDDEFVFEAARPVLLGGMIAWKALINPHTNDTRIWTFDRRSGVGAPTHNNVMDALGWKVEDDVVYAEGYGYGEHAVVFGRRMTDPEDRLRRGWREATDDEIRQAREVLDRNTRTLRSWENMFKAARVGEAVTDLEFEAEHPRGFGGRFRDKPDLQIVDHLRHLQDEFGDALNLPSVEQQQARSATMGQRNADQVSWLMDKLKSLPVGSEIEITQDDVNLLRLGPEAAGVISGLPGIYVKREAQVGDPGVNAQSYDKTRFYKRERVGRMVQRDDGTTDAEWADRYKPTARIVGDRGVRSYDIPLRYTDFADQYRGALLAPLGWDHFAYDEPPLEEIAKVIEDENPPGEWESRVGWNNDSLKKWPDDVERGVKRGEYFRTKRGWEYYPSYADMYENEDDYTDGVPTKDGELIGDSLALAKLMEQRWRYHLRNRHLSREYDEEHRIVQESIDAKYDPQLYRQDDGGPGEAYKQQHALIMEAGDVLDQEIADEIAKADLPDDHELARARSDREKADNAYHAAHTAQFIVAKEEGQAAYRDYLERLGFKLLDGEGRLDGVSITLSNTETVDPGDQPFTYGTVAWRLEHDLARMIDKRRLNKTLQEGEAGWAGEFQHLRENDPVEFLKLLKRAANEMSEMIDKRIAAAVSLKDLIAPVRDRQADLQEADAHLGWVRNEQKKKFKIILDVLSRHRSMGGQTLKVRNQRLTKGIRQVIDSAKYLPTDWIDTSNGEPPPAVYTFKGKRAKYLATDGEIRTNGYMGTSLHELVHHMERIRPTIDAAQWVFWQRRVREGDWSKGMPTPAQMPGYNSGEVGVRDEFKDAYSGKVYGGGQPGAHWEVLTTGIPALFGLAHERVVWEDDDYRKFVLGALALV